MANLLERASIVLTPTAYNNGEALCVKPDDGSGDFDFSRATEGTRINSQGLVEVVANNLPRINYEGGCGSWLFEPQSTNLITYSEDFSQWTTGGDTAIESGFLAPDGTNNAYKVSGTSSALTLNAALSTTTTRSIYARTVSGTGQANLCSFNSNTNNLFTITEQWQRFDVNSANATGVTSFYAVDFRGATNLSEIILWGANATNDQDYATSYIPSNGTSVTRNQDVCTNGGSVSTINSTEGTLYLDIAALSDDLTFRSISLNDGTNTNSVGIRYRTNSNRVNVIIKDGNGVTLQMNVDISDITQFNKIALRYKSGDVSLYINGTEVATNSLSFSFTVALNDLNFDRGDNNDKFFGKTKCLAVWKEALSDENLAELTTI